MDGATSSEQFILNIYKKVKYQYKSLKNPSVIFR